MIRAGTFWSGITTAVVLAIPVAAGFGLYEFLQVYESGHFLSLCAYGLLALGSLLGYRFLKAKATATGIEVQASEEPPKVQNEDRDPLDRPRWRL